jgi:pilus assembly protein CpaE
MAELVTVQHVEQIIALGQRRYDYIVVDLGTSLDERALSVMDAADVIFVLLTPDIPAIKNVRLFMVVADSLGYGQDKIKLVLNKARPKGGIDAAAIERHLKQPIVASIPDSPRVVQAAVNRGVPLLLFEREVNKEIPVTRQLLTLVEQVPEPKSVAEDALAEHRVAHPAERIMSSKSEPPPDKKGLFGRLFGRD